MWLHWQLQQSYSSWAFELFEGCSFGKIIKPQDIEFSWLIVAILLASIAVKCVMAVYNFYFSKKLDSSTLEATGRDSLSDCIATSVVLAATLIAHFSGLNLGWNRRCICVIVYYSIQGYHQPERR